MDAMRRNKRLERILGLDMMLKDRMPLLPH